MWKGVFTFIFTAPKKRSVVKMLVQATTVIVTDKIADPVGCRIYCMTGCRAFAGYGILHVVFLLFSTNPKFF